MYYIYDYLVGQSGAYQVSPPLPNRKALYRYLREFQGLERIYGEVKVISRKLHMPKQGRIATPRLVKAGA